MMIAAHSSVVCRQQNHLRERGKVQVVPHRRTPLSAHFLISLPKRHHFASCSLVALLEPPPFFFISHVPTRPLHSFIFFWTLIGPNGCGKSTLLKFWTLIGLNGCGKSTLLKCMFFLCSLLVLFCIQIASLEEDKNAFGMTQSKELATLLEAEKISCGKSEVDFIVSFFYGKPDLICGDKQTQDVLVLKDCSICIPCIQWVWKIYHLEVLFCIQIASLEEDKKAFGTTQHCLKQRRFRVVNLKWISLSLIFFIYIEYIIETNKEASGFSKIHPIIINIGTNNLETQKESDCTFLRLGFCGNPKQRFLPSTYPAEQIHSNMIKMSTQSSTSSNVDREKLAKATNGYDKVNDLISKFGKPIAQEESSEKYLVAQEEVLLAQLRPIQNKLNAVLQKITNIQSSKESNEKQKEMLFSVATSNAKFLKNIWKRS
ncbi:hypothetical protein D0Y65_011690 [Glycine soja]|uniref:Uncharacterized protein n=1 Tax=Glycine soja TaxID=3848 RepID=A0A445KL53_GLYSO|nr:hypothetical protein D0Y65_011690 [Glycine soja]